MDIHQHYDRLVNYLFRLQKKVEVSDPELAQRIRRALLMLRGMYNEAVNSLEYALSQAGLLDIIPPDLSDEQLDNAHEDDDADVIGQWN